MESIKEEYIKEELEECVECNEEEHIDEEELSCTAPEIVRAARKNVSFDLLPQKSREKYEKQYKIFVAWCKANNEVGRYTENVMLAYFSEKAKTKKSSTLWSLFSMLRSVLCVKNDVDIRQYRRLVAFLKRQSVGYEANKTKIFTKEEVLKFISEAPNEVYLLEKVVLIMGIFGACGRDELVKISINDIEDADSQLIVKILETKTNRSRIFTVTNDSGEMVDFLSFYRKYVALRPSEPDTPSRLFLRYYNGRCTKQVVGMNVIGHIPSKIARFLNLRDFKLYTGYTFRRTSATFLVNGGADRDCWKSSTVAQGNIVNRVETTHKITGASKTTEQNQTITYVKESDIPFPENGLVIKDCSNCTFNFNIVNNYYS